MQCLLIQFINSFNAKITPRYTLQYEVRNNPTTHNIRTTIKLPQDELKPKKWYPFR